MIAQILLAALAVYMIAGGLLFLPLAWMARSFAVLLAGMLFGVPFAILCAVTESRDPRPLR
jgi:hypothetical protein